jgi:integrase
MTHSSAQANYASCVAYGGLLGISWTNDDFNAAQWRARSPNPSLGTIEGVRFDRLPEEFRMSARMVLWASEHAVLDDSRAGRSSSPGTARLKMSFFVYLASSLSNLAIARLQDVTPGVLDAVFLGYCGITGQLPSKTRARARQFLDFLSRLYEFGPAAEHWMPDGLLFDPRRYLVQYLKHPMLLDSNGTPELDDDTGRALANYAIDFVERLVEPVITLMTVSEEIRKAKAASKSAPSSQQYAAMAIDRLFEQQPNLLKAFRAARLKFPVALWHFVRSRSLLSPTYAEMPDERRDLLLLGLISKRLHLRAQAMCFTVLDFFNGWRASELLSIEMGTLRKQSDGWHQASKVRKTGLNPDADVYRPIPDVCALAVKALVKLNRSMIKAHLRRLFRSTTGGTSRLTAVNLVMTEVAREFTGDMELAVTSHMLRRFFGCSMSGDTEAILTRFDVTSGT